MYSAEVLYINDRFTVALRHVESIGFPDGEELTIDILSGDCHIDIVTVSGAKYSASMKYLQNRLTYLSEKPLRDIRNEVYFKWVSLMGKN